MEIRKQAFDGSGIKELTLPHSLTSLSSSFITDCPELKTLTITYDAARGGLSTLESNAIDTKSYNTTVCFENPDIVLNDNAVVGENLTIKGYVGSTAQAYAVKNNIRFVHYGDHSYTTAWNWSDDHMSATMRIICSGGDVDETINAVVTKNYISATGKDVYTATAVYDGVTYQTTYESGHTHELYVKNWNTENLDNVYALLWCRDRDCFFATLQKADKTGESIVKEATCAQAGQKKYTFEVTYDGQRFETEVTRDYYGPHDLKHEDATVPTVSDNGTVEHWHCSVCGKNFDSADGSHELGEEALYVPYFTFSYFNGEYTLSAYNGTDYEISVPDVIPQNYPVASYRGHSFSAIDVGAFRDNTRIIYLTIGDNISQIRGYAFENCTSLHHVYIGTGLTWIMDYAFSNCTDLSIVNVKSRQEHLSVDARAFDGCDDETLTLYGYHATGFETYAKYHYKKFIPLEHIYGDPVWTWSDDGTAASVSKKCKYCEETLSTVAAVSEIGRKASTCTEKGWIKYEAAATLDGEKLTDRKTRMLDVTPHTFGTPDWTWNDDWTEAQAAFTCSACGHQHTVNADISQSTSESSVTVTATVIFNGQTYTDTKTYTKGHIAKKDPHDFEDGNIEVWIRTADGFSRYFKDEAMTEEVTWDEIIIPYYAYELGENAEHPEQNYYLIKKFNGDDTSTYIPTTYNELPVKGIAEGAFADSTALEEITIGDRVESIGKNAFDGCSALEKVNIGMGLKIIGDKAFANCGQLKEIRIFAQETFAYSSDVFENSADDLKVYGYSGTSVQSLAEDTLRTFVPFSVTYSDPVWNWEKSGNTYTAKLTLTATDNSLVTGNPYQVEISADVTSERKPLDCTQTGHPFYTAVAVDSNGKSYTDTKLDSETVYPPALHTWGEWTKVSDPYCRAPGKNKRTCSACGATETAEIAAPGHTFEEFEYRMAVDNHCLDTSVAWEQGSTTTTIHVYECTDCGLIIERFEGTTNYLIRIPANYEEKDPSGKSLYNTICLLDTRLSSYLNGGETVAAGGLIAGTLVAIVADIGLKTFLATVGVVALVAAVSVAAAIMIYYITHGGGEGGGDPHPGHVWNDYVHPATCTKAGVEGERCFLCGKTRNNKTIDPLGHRWGQWGDPEYDSEEQLYFRIRRCTRNNCTEQEKQKTPNLSSIQLGIEYTDDGTYYSKDPFKADETGLTNVGEFTGCKVYLDDPDDSGKIFFRSWPEGLFNFTCQENNDYVFECWNTDTARDIRLPRTYVNRTQGDHFATARFKLNRSLTISHSAYDGSDKGKGTAKKDTMKLMVKVKSGDEVIKTYTKQEGPISIDTQYLKPEYTLAVTLYSSSDENCAFIKDTRSDSFKGADVGEQNRKVSDADDKDIHIHKDNEHTYTVKIADLITDGKLTVDKIEYKTDYEKGRSIKGEKTDKNSFPGASTKIHYKRNKKDADSDATDGITVIYQDGDAFKISASVPDGNKVGFNGWREGVKIVTEEKNYSSTVYANAAYTPMFSLVDNQELIINYVDEFGDFLAQKKIGEEPPAVTPGKYAGYEFMGWDKSPTEVLTSGETITALYRKTIKKVGITADGCTIRYTGNGETGLTIGDYAEADYDTKVTVSAPDAKAWKIDGQIVAYGDSCTFYACAYKTLVKVTEYPETTVPQVKIISAERYTDSEGTDSYKICFLATRTVPEDFTFIQAGFVYGKNLDENDLNLDNVGKSGHHENSGTVKAAYCARTEDDDQFFLIYGVKSESAPATARAFISYKDKDGKVHVLYSDVAVFNYEEGESNVG